MSSWISRQLMALSLGATLLFAAPIVRGDLVSYTTTGSFFDISNMNLGSSVVFANQIPSGPNTFFTLTFTGTAVTKHNTFVDSPTVSLGTLSLAIATTPPASGFAAFGGDTFKLNVNQITPPGSASPQASLSGQIFISPPTFNSGTATLTFASSSNPFKINFQTYSIANGGSLTLSAVNNGAGSGPVSLDATLVSAPVPATASMGFAFLATMGLAYAATSWRKRNQVRVA